MGNGSGKEMLLRRASSHAFPGRAWLAGIFSGGQVAARRQVYTFTRLPGEGMACRLAMVLGSAALLLLAEPVVAMPVASIRAVESQAMKDLLWARFEVSLSEAAATDLRVDLEFSKTNNNALIIATFEDEFITIPAGQTSAEGDFRIVYSGSTMLTATIATGDGYANAPAPANAAMVEVVGQSALTVSWVEDEYTVEEGDNVSPVLQFTLPPGFPMPRGSIKVSVQSQADTAILIQDYTNYARTPSLPAANWNDDDNDTAYTGLLTVSVATKEDTIHEPEERFFLVLDTAPGTSPNIECAQKVNGDCLTTITITDDDPNTPPTSEDGEVTADEDTAYSFAVADFSFMDEDTAHSNTFQGVTVATLPAADKGVLQLDGVDVTTGQQIARAALEASPGLFTYAPPADENGDDFASFTFRVNDGTDDSENAYTMTIDVTAVADAPRVANPIPDRSAAVDVAFSYQVPSNAFEDGDGDTLTYTATQDDDSALPSWLSFATTTRTFSGTPTTSDLGQITVKVTASDGDTDTSDEFVLTVREVPNTLPTAENSTVTATEDAAYTFTATNFSFTDADDDSLESVRITSLETAGDLQLDGADVTANQVITKTDIDANKLTFMAAANANGTAYATFGFTVSDGADESAAPYTMTIDVTPVNDPPTVGNPIPDQTATQGSEPPFSFTLPDDAFEDIDGDTLTYTATLANANNDPLPDWLSLDPATGVFTGTPATAGTLTVRVTASDPSGTSSPPNDFDIVVEAAPVFADTMVTRSVAENAAADTNVGTPIPPATDADSDGLTYTLEGDDAAAFDFDATTRQITTKAGVNYDFEAQPSYEVMIKAEDGKGGVGRVTVSINLTDQVEPPATPAAPVVTATPNTATRLEVTWTAPPNDGRPPITSYHLRTCAGASADCTMDEDFTDGPTGQTGTSAAITGLMEDTLYQVQVRASNAEGDSDWSTSGSDRTGTAADIIPPTVSLTRAAPAVEGDALDFTLTLDRAAPTELSVTVTVSETEDVVADNNEGRRTVTVAQGRTQAMFTVATQDDDMDEADSVVTAMVVADNTDPATYQVGSALVAAVTVADNDSAATAADRTAPTVTSILRQMPATSPTNANSLTWRVVFSEAVMNVDATDFMVGGSTATVTNAQAVGGEMLAYDVTVSGGDLAGLNGTVTLGIASGQDIQDEAGTPLATTTPTDTSDNTYVVDNAAQNEAEAETVLDQVVVPNVVQQLMAETTEAITSRLKTIASGSPPSIPPVTINLDEVLADTVAVLHGQRERIEDGGSLEWWQVFAGRDFALPLPELPLAQGESADGQEKKGPLPPPLPKLPLTQGEGADGQKERHSSSLTVWGGGDYSSYENTIRNTDVGGNGFSGVIGMDMQPIPQLVTGLALTTSRWGLDYATDANGARAEGTYEIGLTVLNPYISWLATDRLSFWATFGYGRGEVEQTLDGDASANTQTDNLTSWAGGLRFALLPGVDPRTGKIAPFGLAFKVDGATSSFLDTHVQLARLAAEVSRTFPIDNSLLTAALDLGWSIRSASGKDNLDAQQQAIADKSTDGGAELAGSINWRNADSSVSATVDTRVLLGDDHHREWGVGGSLHLTTSRRDGEGLSLTLQPSFGATATRLDELWSLSGDGDLAMGNDQPGARLEAELAYGFPLGNAILTSYTQVTLEEGASIYVAGLRYGLNTFLDLDLKGAHHSHANGNIENRFSLDMRSDL